MKRQVATFVILATASLLLFKVAFADGDTGTGALVQPQHVASGYYPVSTSGAYRSGVSAGDPADIDSTTVTALPVISCGGKTTIAVNGTFSASAATALIEVVRYRAGEIRGYSQGTLTAVTTAPTTGGRYPCQTLYFDTGNCDHVRVLFRGNPSSGNVTLKVDSY